MGDFARFFSFYISPGLSPIATQARGSACQLFIEQEIEKGLNEGKTKYVIGQEIADWLKEKLQIEYKAHTLAERARYVEKKIGRTLPSDSTPEDDSEKEKIQDDHGGAREGVGRPTRKEAERKREKEKRMEQERAELGPSGWPVIRTLNHPKSYWSMFPGLPVLAQLPEGFAGFGLSPGGSPPARGASISAAGFLLGTAGRGMCGAVGPLPGGGSGRGLGWRGACPDLSRQRAPGGLSSLSKPGARRAV